MANVRAENFRKTDAARPVVWWSNVTVRDDEEVSVTLTDENASEWRTLYVP